MVRRQGASQNDTFRERLYCIRLIFLKKCLVFYIKLCQMNRGVRF